MPTLEWMTTFEEAETCAQCGGPVNHSYVVRLVKVGEWQVPLVHLVCPNCERSRS